MSLTHSGMAALGTGCAPVLPKPRGPCPGTFVSPRARHGSLPWVAGCQLPAAAGWREGGGRKEGGALQVPAGKPQRCERKRCPGRAGGLCKAEVAASESCSHPVWREVMLVEGLERIPHFHPWVHCDHPPHNHTCLMSLLSPPAGRSGGNRVAQSASLPPPALKHPIIASP